MRGSGSNDVVIENLFVPDGCVAFSRKAGEWHPVFQIIATIAFPLVYAVYLGVAESARDIAIDIAKRMPHRTCRLPAAWTPSSAARNLRTVGCSTRSLATLLPRIRSTRS